MEKKYYSSIVITSAVMGVIAFLIAAAIDIVRHNTLPDAERLGIGLVESLGLCALLTAIAIPLYPVILRPEGLTTYSFSGFYHTLTWADIARVGSLNMMGLRYVTIHTTNGKTLYVPHFLGDFEGFRQQVAAWAGELHPFTIALFDDQPAFLGQIIHRRQAPSQPPGQVTAHSLRMLVDERTPGCGIAG